MKVINTSTHLRNKTVKRSKQIDVDLMRKVGLSIASAPKLKPLALAIATLVLTSCSSKEEVIIVKSVEDCQSKTEFTFEQCEAAYAKAVAEAERTGPKYSTQAACEAEFGVSQCRQTSQNNMFMPFMAGFIVSNLLDNNRNYGYNPVYDYRDARSSYNNRLMTSDGIVLGSPGKSSYKVSKSALKSKPSVTKTISRGGFGSKASAKSSWGGGKSSGWGG